MGELTVYNEACRALAEAKDYDDAKGIINKSEAIWAYAKKAGNKTLEADAWEIRRRATRTLGEIMKEKKDAHEMAPPGPTPEIGSNSDPISEPPLSLAEAGIDKHLADASRKAIAMPEEKFELQIAKKRNTIINGAHVSKNSGENEWYTPTYLIEAAREVMGSIDLDPASCELANKAVKASAYFTVEDDGTVKEWYANVWLNPPYAQPAIKKFAQHVIDEYISQHVVQACVLVNNATETGWFQPMLKECAAVCFISGRVKFIDKDGNPGGAPLQGQAVLYFGARVEFFADVFSEFGPVMVPT